MARESIVTTCVTLLTLIALLRVTRLAEGLSAPIVAAIVLGLVCASATDFVERAGKRLSGALLCKAEARVSGYFITIMVINAIFGALVGVAMTALGLANPILWGRAAFLVNFVL